MRLLVEGGMAALTFQNVADRAGVSRATMYRRWSSPAHLAADVIRTTAGDAIPIVDTGALHADLTAVLSGVGEFIGTPIGRAALIASLEIGPSESGEVQSWAGRWDQVLPIFDRAVARGELAADVDASALFAALAGALYFRVLVMGRPVDEAWIERVLATTLGHDGSS